MITRDTKLRGRAASVATIAFAIMALVLATAACVGYRETLYCTVIEHVRDVENDTYALKADTVKYGVLLFPVDEETYYAFEDNDGAKCVVEMDSIDTVGIKIRELGSSLATDN